MTNNIEQTKPSNKKLWITLAGISITVIGSTLLFFGVTSNTSDGRPDAQSSSQAKTISTLGVPTIETVETKVNAKELTFSISVKDFDASKGSLEYQIADQNREVQGEGKAHAEKFEASVTLSDSASYRIKVRTTNDGGKSDWSEAYTVKLSELEGFKTVEPSPAYYSTGWATGSDTSLNGAKEAITTAWNANEVVAQDQLRGCLPINTGDMTSKLLLPPIPSVMPKQVTLKYMTNSWDGKAVSITYLWCER